jgi:hypothetical protein
MLDLFKDRKPIIAVIHLPPLPGSPRWSGPPNCRRAGNMSHVLECVARDTRILADSGADAILVENFGDMPFPPSSSPPETVAAMTLATAEAMRSCSLPVGVNVLRNDAAAAVAIAAATGAAFIRVNVHCGVAFAGEGILEGRAHETLRLRQRLAPDLAIFADILVKHAWGAWAPASSGRADEVQIPAALPQWRLTVSGLARDTAYRGLADALIVTGPATGEPPLDFARGGAVWPARGDAELAEALPDFSLAARIKEAVPDRPVLVGSGVTAHTVKQALSVADGVIVGSALKESGRAGNRVDPERAKIFFDAASG